MAPDVSEPSRRYALDGVRVLAALQVLVFHAYQHNRTGPDARWPLADTVWHVVVVNGVPAVTIFFVLSGFLVGLPYARAALQDAPLKPTSTIVRRRLSRLVPLYWVVVLLVWCVTNPALPGDWRDLLLHLTFTQVHTDDRIFSTNGPAWTLAVEVHFFLLVVALGPFTVRRMRTVPRARRPAALAGCVLGLVLLSWAYRFWAAEVADVPWERWSVWFNPLAKLDTFAVGLLLAVLAAAGLQLRSGWQQRLVACTGAGLVAAAAALSPVVDVRTWYLHTIAAVGCAVLVSAVALVDRAPRWLSWRGTTFVASLAFGLYLWQEPVKRLLAELRLLPEPAPGPAFLLTSAVLLAVTLVVAWIGLHLVERPLARLVHPAAGRPRRGDEGACPAGHGPPVAGHGPATDRAARVVATVRPAAARPGTAVGPRSRTSL